MTAAQCRSRHLPSARRGDRGQWDHLPESPINSQSCQEVAVMSRAQAKWIGIATAVLLVIGPVGASPAQKVTKQSVLRSIEMAKRFLISRQKANGAWPSGLGGDYQVGVSSLALLALINAGMTVDDPPVAKGLRFLRSIKEPEPSRTYEVSLMIMALAAAKDDRRDQARISILAQKLEQSQVKRGANAGMWSYSVKPGLGGFGGDNSNTQFAVLGLRDAALAGVPVNRAVWERIRQHFLDCQNADGGWGYSRSHNQTPTGSMTVAGIASLVIADMMLADDSDVGPDGKPNCCAPEAPNEALERGIAWLERHFAVGHNPNGNAWGLYYLYGLERAGRLSGRRFFGKHDWYREGAQFLIQKQSRRTGEWRGAALEKDAVVSTSFALLFLSKGLAPVLINKLRYDAGQNEAPGAKPTRRAAWNLHPHDVRNLTELICGLPKWPKLMTWQVVDLDRVAEQGGVVDLMQSPILYLCGDQTLPFTDAHVRLLREYVNNGGFIFAVNGCHSSAFDESFRKLIQRMYPEGMAELRPLRPEHPI
ncbi:MAG TPA: DUF4159 domain-containing protein, partial [Planctomycetaceae bacterium]|nr:DUF4159 domain-containing protein [Planctomycetaceae bacterium]